MTEQFFKYTDRLVSFTQTDKDLLTSALTFKQVEVKTELVLAANSKSFQTISLRPPMIWGKGDPNTLAGVIEAVKKGRMQFIDGGKHRLVTCQVINVCHALILADQSEQVGGNAYFLTDGETPIFKDFIKKYAGTQG